MDMQVETKSWLAGKLCMKRMWDTYSMLLLDLIDGYNFMLCVINCGFEAGRLDVCFLFFKAVGYHGILFKVKSCLEFYLIIIHFPRHRHAIGSLFAHRYDVCKYEWECTVLRRRN